MKEIDALAEKLRVIQKDRNTHGYNIENGIAMSILSMTVGDKHPIAIALQKNPGNYSDANHGLCESVLALYDAGALIDARIRIAAEIEGDILDIAEQQLKEAKQTTGSIQKLRLGVAAFLAGAILEDSLRRLCDKHRTQYDPAHATIKKLVLLLYSPSKQIELITKSEMKTIDCWGDVRNRADHGNFSEICEVDVETMIMGIRQFIAKHLN